MNFYQQFNHLKYVNLPNGEKYAYRDIGSGPQTLILLHGCYFSSFMFNELAPLLATQFRVIAPDMRGFGHSTHNNYLTIPHEELSDDIKLFMDALHVSRCIMLGWATSVPTVAYFAIKYPEKLERMVLLSPFSPKGMQVVKLNPLTRKETGEIAKTKEEIIEDSNVSVFLKAYQAKDKDFFRNVWGMFFKNSKLDEKIMDHLVEDVFLQKHPEEFVVADATFNITEEANGFKIGNGLIKKIKTKALIIHEDEDNITPVKDAFEWKNHLNDLADVEILKGCGQLFDTHTQSVANLINSLKI